MKSVAWAKWCQSSLSSGGRKISRWATQAERYPQTPRQEAPLAKLQRIQAEWQGVWGHTPVVHIPRPENLVEQNWLMPGLASLPRDSQPSSGPIPPARSGGSQFYTHTHTRAHARVYMVLPRGPGGLWGYMRSLLMLSLPSPLMRANVCRPLRWLRSAARFGPFSVAQWWGPMVGGQATWPCCVTGRSGRSPAFSTCPNVLAIRLETSSISFSLTSQAAARDPSV